MGIDGLWLLGWWGFGAFACWVTNKIVTEFTKENITYGNIISLFALSFIWPVLIIVWVVEISDRDILNIKVFKQNNKDEVDLKD